MSNTIGISIPESLKGDDIIPTKTRQFNRPYRQHGLVNENENNKCPICGSTSFTVDSARAEVSCDRCGLVLDESLIDNGPEWRAFDHEQRNKRARTGAPSTFAISDKGLSTTMGTRNVDSKGRSIPERNRAQFYRMREWNKRIRVSSAAERNLAIALSEMDRLSSRLGIPRSVREDSAYIYRNAAKMNIIRGRSIDGVVAASVYTACRVCGLPRTLDEVSEASNISKKRIGKNYRFLARELGIKLKPTSPTDYISRFASKLNLSGEVQAKAIEIINQFIGSGLSSGKGPSSIAAAALYIASILSGDRRTQSEIAQISGVTEVTIRNRYKELSEQLDSVI